MTQDSSLRSTRGSRGVLNVVRLIERECRLSLPQFVQSDAIAHRDNLIPAKETIRMGFADQNEIFQERQLSRR